MYVFRAIIRRLIIRIRMLYVSRHVHFNHLSIHPSIRPYVIGILSISTIANHVGIRNKLRLSTVHLKTLTTALLVGISERRK